MSFQIKTNTLLFTPTMLQQMNYFSVASPFSTQNPVMPKPHELDFDPNAQPQPEYATYVKRRRPAFKHHKTRATALNAAIWHRHQGVILYHWNARLALWEEIYRCVDWQCRRHCALCKAPFSMGTYHRGKAVWEKNFATRRIAEPLNILALCSSCYAGYR